MGVIGRSGEEMAGDDERRRSKCLTEKQGATAADATGVAERPSALTSAGEMGQRGLAVNTWSGRSRRLERRRVGRRTSSGAGHGH